MSKKPNPSAEEPKPLTIDDIQNDDDLDTFAQALLHRKTEMLIYQEDLAEVPAELPLPTPEERQEAEEAMSEALDRLRMERGQMPISQEEAGIPQPEAPESKPEQTEEKPESEPAKEKPEPKKRYRKVTFSKEDNDIARVYKLPRTLTLDEKKKRIVAIAAAAVLVLLAAFGLYVWKVQVYNPNNISSEEQQKAYDKLVAYADEYSSGLMSDAEKLEILGLKPDYDSLLQKQKDQINAYFREQTREGKSSGRTFMDIYNEQLQMKKDAEDQAQPEYQALMDYLANWETKTEEEKAQIVHYKETYDKLSDTLKYNVDALLRENANTTFPEQYNIYQTATPETGSTDAQRSEWQSQLDSKTAELQTYQDYAAQLQATLESQQAAGEDTSQTQASIDENNALMSQLQAEVDDLQHKLAISQ